MKTVIRNGLIGITLALIMLQSGHAQAAQRFGQGLSNGPAAMAGGGMTGARGMNRMLRRIEFLADELEVTDEQIDEIFEIVDSNRSVVRDLMRSGRETRKQIRDSEDPEQVAELAEQAGDIVTQMIISRNAVRDQMLAVLTDEQRDALEQLKAERGERFRNRRRGN